MSSEASTLRVPMRMGRPFLCSFSTCSATAFHLSIARSVDRVVPLLALDGAVGGDDADGLAVGAFEFGAGLGGGAGHAAEQGVLSEEALEADRREDLLVGGDLDVFLGFDGLVQAVLPGAVGHDAAGVFVDDDDLVFEHLVLLALVVEVVCDEGLLDEFVTQSDGTPDRVVCEVVVVFDELVDGLVAGAGEGDLAFGG